MENGLKCTLDFSIEAMISADGWNLVMCSCDSITRRQLRNHATVQHPLKPLWVLPLTSTDLGSQPKFHSNVNYVHTSLVSGLSMIFYSNTNHRTETVEQISFCTVHFSRSGISIPFWLAVGIFWDAFRHCYKVHRSPQENAKLSQECFPTGDINGALYT